MHPPRPLQYQTLHILQVYGTGSPYGQTGPGLAGYHMDRLGWLPQNETLVFGQDGAVSGDYALRPLTDAQRGGAAALSSDGVAYRLLRVFVNTRCGGGAAHLPRSDGRRGHRAGGASGRQHGRRCVSRQSETPPHTHPPTAHPPATPTSTSP